MYPLLVLLEGEGTKLLGQFRDELEAVILWGGGIWMAVSLVVVGFSIHEENGAGIRKGLLSALGAAVVLGGAALLKTIGV